MSVQLLKLIETSPNAAGTTVGVQTIAGLDKFDSLLIYANLQGATGGTLDVYIQTLLHCTGDSANGTWVDFAHFTQLSAAAAATKKTCFLSRSAQSTTLTTVGIDGSPALAAGTILGGEWGAWWRFVFTAGASTSAGASQSVWVFGTPSHSR
jgi:hypothetical protein